MGNGGKLECGKIREHTLRGGFAAAKKAGKHNTETIKKGGVPLRIFLLCLRFKKTCLDEGHGGISTVCSVSSFRAASSIYSASSVHTVSSIPVISLVFPESSFRNMF